MLTCKMPWLRMPHLNHASGLVEMKDLSSAKDTQEPSQVGRQSGILS